MTPPRSGNAKKLNQNKTPTREDAAESASPLVAVRQVGVRSEPAVVAARVVVAAPPVVTKGLRSMAAAHKERHAMMGVADMCCIPVGPYETEDQMIAAVQAWAGKAGTNGGAFSPLSLI
jgi:hypothetical protein